MFVKVSEWLRNRASHRAFTRLWELEVKTDALRELQDAISDRKAAILRFFVGRIACCFVLGQELVSNKAAYEALYRELNVLDEELDALNREFHTLLVERAAAATDEEYREFREAADKKADEEWSDTRPEWVRVPERLRCCAARLDSIAAAEKNADMQRLAEWLRYRAANLETFAEDDPDMQYITATGDAVRNLIPASASEFREVFDAQRQWLEWEVDCEIKCKDKLATEDPAVQHLTEFLRYRARHRRR